MSDPDILGYAGKRVVLTGCASGIGHATAALLLRAGAKVHGLDWKPSDLDLAAFTHVDLRDEASIEAALEAIDGPVDALFNCAGIAPLGRAPLEVATINFIAARHLTERLVERMPQGSAIVSIASMGGMRWRRHLEELKAFVAVAGFEAARDWCAARPELLDNGYGFSKEAMIVWTFIRSAELIGRGIRINCTMPGAVQTGLLAEFETFVGGGGQIDSVTAPIGRRGRPDEQALPLVMLGSPLGSYMNGLALPVDGGYSAILNLAQS